jgi:predicted nucleotidyltransferase component of viral defense system
MDADYSFQPSKSKKDFSEDIIDFMNEICDAPVRHSMDSKKLKIDGVYHQSKIVIEANAHEAFEPQAISTTTMAKKYDLQSCVISIVPNDMAFANKCGAWLDRRLARDLYDIYIYLEVLRVKPDLEILQKRILKPSYARQVKERPHLSDIDDFLCFLKSECDKVSDQDIETELMAIIPPDELLGLGGEIQKVIRKTRSLR